ncbi:hypothetical protein ACFYZ3_13935 [Streptomyces sp. NPDC001599]|uniref:hypothetical protein n=1 Tax=Streptomyces sp. NPDC001599 TaxID=3364591 RepID=UPI00368F63E8
MYAGLGLTVVVAAAPYAELAGGHLLADHIRAGCPTYPQTRIDSAVTTCLVLLTVVGALGALARLWSIWAVRVGKPWARSAATVLFALGASAGSTGLLAKDTSGATGLPSALGRALVAPCLAGLLAVTRLWWRPRPE